MNRLTNFLSLLCMALPAQAQWRDIDLCEAQDAWKTIASEGVRISLSTEQGREGRCLRIDYEFVTGSGFCIVQRPVSMNLPSGSFEFSFDVRGEGPSNDLEFKLLDTGGDLSLDAEKATVWWLNRRGFEPPPEWTTLRNVKRDISFAWGTGSQERLARVDKLEFAIASRKGGKGTISIDSIRFREIAPPPDPLPATTITPSSSAAGAGFLTMIEGSGAPWSPSPSDASPSFTIDFGYSRELSGLWLTGDAMRDYTVELSEDGQSFHEHAAWKGRRGTRQLVPLFDAQSRYVRLTFAPPGVDLKVSRIEPVDAGVFAKPEDIVVREAPQTQRPWTIIGRPYESREALMNVDGAVEIGSGMCSIQPPRIRAGDEWIRATPSGVALEAPGVPMPRVEWTAGAIQGRTFAWAPMSEQSVGERQSPGSLQVDYELTATSAFKGSIALDVVPWQVNPKWQFLTTPGGFAPIRSVQATDGSLVVNNSERFVPSPGAAVLAGASFASRELPTVFLPDPSAHTLADGEGVTDARGLACGVIQWDVDLKQGETTTLRIVVPWGDGEVSPVLLRQECINAWQNTVRARILMPQERDAIAQTAASTVSYILVNADRASIQPGSRSYERSWIRDGSLTSAALLRWGRAQDAVNFIDWYAKHLIVIGPGVLKAPCVVDWRGPDPVPENDSHGQYIFAVLDAYMFTRDRAILERHWPKVKSVAAYIDQLRNTRMTNEFRPGGPARQEPGKPPVRAEAFWGLMPESISHEGYSSKPMHSHWDNLWTLEGLRCAAQIAAILDDQGYVDGYTDLAKSMEAAIANSIQVAGAAHGISYFPGCVELGDFDSTSTTIAVWPCDVTGVPGISAAVDETFERYWRFFSERAAKGNWEAFTPYELRHVGAYARMGRPEAAVACLDWLMAYRRPAEWHQWAEVVWKDADAPKFIGDMPHTWCGSDFLNSLSAMLVYEKNDALVLFKGIPSEWLTLTGPVGFERLSTWYGTLSARMEEVRGQGASPADVVIELSGDASPPAGFVVRNPRNLPAVRCTVNGQIVPMNSETVIVRALPARVVLHYQQVNER